MNPTLRSLALTPALVAFVASPRLRSRPHGIYRWLGRLDPVHQSPLGIWVFTRHAEVTAALRHPALGSDERQADPEAVRFLRVLNRVLGRKQGEGPEPAPGPFFEMFSQVMLFRDPPDHTRLRSLVNKAFTPRAVAAIEPRITAAVDDLLEPLAPKGGMDVLHDLAYPLPARIICEMLGVPVEHQDAIVRHAPALATGLDPAPMRPPEAVAAADRATVELAHILERLIADRRRQPGEDLLSGLLAAEDDGDRLSHDELVATVLLLLIAGHETTANLIGNGLLALMRHPQQLAELRAEPGLDRSAIDELLRFDGPIQMTERITLADVELGGNHIPKGRVVVLCTAAANRDPAVFDQPDRLDLRRSPNPHVGFGGGSHFCLGAPLARLEARIAIRALVDRFSGLRLADPRPCWRPSFTIRGLTALPVCW